MAGAALAREKGHTAHNSRGLMLHTAGRALCTLSFPQQGSASGLRKVYYPSVTAGDGPPPAQHQKLQIVGQDGMGWAGGMGIPSPGYTADGGAICWFDALHAPCGCEGGGAQRLQQHGEEGADVGCHCLRPSSLPGMLWQGQGRHCGEWLQTSCL
jgi:hypothetical protein